MLTRFEIFHFFYVRFVLTLTLKIFAIPSKTSKIF